MADFPAVRRGHGGPARVEMLKGGNSLPENPMTAAEQNTGGKLPGEDEIDETLEESFPASDPPGWTLGVDADHRPGEDTPEEREQETNLGMNLHPGG